MTTTQTSFGQMRCSLGYLFLVIRASLGLAIIIAAGLIGDARAQAVLCVPQAFGVPGLPGAPRWWDPADPANQPGHGYNPTDPQWDPRWRGARGDGYGGGATNDVRVRALFATENNVTYLYISWFVNFAPTFSPNNTSIYIGLSPSPSDSLSNPIATVIQATFASDTQGQPQGVNGPYWGVTVYQGTWQAGPTPVTLPPVSPNWLTQVNQDTTNGLNFTGRAWANGQDINHPWAVNLRIPIDANSAGDNGIFLGDITSFKIWFYVQPDITVLAGTTGLIYYTWPRSQQSDGLKYVAYDQPQLVFPNPDTWGPAALQQSPQSNQSCQNGISLDSDQIGVIMGANPNPNGPLGWQIDASGPNTFFARPSNYSSTDIQPNVVKARFRIASWGSQVGDLTSSSWQDLPNLAAVPNAGIIPKLVSPGNPGQGNIHGPLDFSSSAPAIRDLHCKLVGQAGDPTNCAGIIPSFEPYDQCLLVTLTGAGVDFINDSAYRNMTFKTASSFRQEAEININGLPPVAGSPARDVYLSLERRNMPGFPMIAAGSSTRVASRSAVGDQPPRLASTFDELAQTAPTYIVHAYYDTGLKITRNGVVHPMLQPLTSFGYFMQHSGLLFGWQPSIEGATEIAPNIYKVSVPNGGAVKVITSINTIDLTTWWIWLIILAIVLIVLFLIWFVRRLVHAHP